MNKIENTAMTIRIPLNIRIELDKIAKEESRSVNGMITFILKEYCDKYKKQKK